MKPKEKIVLLPLTEMKKFSTIHCVLENDEVYLEFDSGHTYSLHGFSFEEWEKFVKGIGKADKRLKEIKGVKYCYKR